LSYVQYFKELLPIKKPLFKELTSGSKAILFMTLFALTTITFPLPSKKASAKVQKLLLPFQEDEEKI
jgi:hypothetical protein